MISESLRRGAALNVAFIYWFFPEGWYTRSQPLFQAFLGFVVRSTSEYLAPEHPCTILAKLFQKTPSYHARLRMWDCILDNADVLLGGTASWWLLAGQRLECYRVAGIGELALKYCHEAAVAARKSNIFTVRMEVRVLCEL